MFNLKKPTFMRKIRLNGNEKGFTLIEVLIAIAFFMVIVVGILMAISTSSRVLAMANNKEIAKDIASSDMEYIRTRDWGSDYSASLPPPPAEYSNFQTSVVVTFLQTGLQQIDITVLFQGKTIFTLTDYRMSY